MKNRWKAGAWLLLAAATLLLPRRAAADKKSDKSPSEPFYHQFLIPGYPPDEKLLAQERLVAANPESAPLRNDFGNLLAERRFPKEARAEYKKALQLDRKFFLAAYNLGLLEETEGRVSAAISSYKEAIDRRRGFPPAHFRLGFLYEKLSRDDEAIQEYAKAIWIDNAMRDPRVNPLVVESRLMDQVSLYNYSRDLARAAMPRALGYVNVARLRPVPVDRTLDTEEVVEEAGPQTIETRKTGPPPGVRSPIPGPGRAPVMPRPQAIRPGRREMPPSPAPTPIPEEAPPPTEPEPEPQG